MFLNCVNTLFISNIVTYVLKFKISYTIDKTIPRDG